MGVGYASWTQNLAVGGNVSTGTYDVKLATPVATNDVNGIATAAIVTPLPGDGHSFTVNLRNIYPGTVENVTFNIDNPGSIPAKITAVAITGYGAPPQNINIGGSGALDVNVSLSGLIVGDTIAATATKTGCKLTITTLGTVDPSITGGSFTFTIDTAQQY